MLSNLHVRSFRDNVRKTHSFYPVSSSETRTKHFKRQCQYWNHRSFELWILPRECLRWIDKISRYAFCTISVSFLEKRFECPPNLWIEQRWKAPLPASSVPEKFWRCSTGYVLRRLLPSTNTDTSPATCWNWISFLSGSSFKYIGGL